MIQFIWALYVSALLGFLTWVFSLLFEFDDGLTELQHSPAVVLFSQVAATLGECHGKSAVPCGTTAECMEDRVLFNDSSFADITKPGFRNGRTIFRLHFEIDADNVSNDHVLFVAPFHNCVVVLSSYIHAHPATVQIRGWRWLMQLDSMVKGADSEAWNALFEVVDEFVQPVSMCTHVSVAVI